MGLSVERSRAALYRQIRTELSRLCIEAHCRTVLIIDRLLGHVFTIARGDRSKG